MKRFKIGFLAVVAIIAMSFTVATQVDFKSDDGAATVTSCFGDIDYFGVTTPTNPCGTSTNLLFNSTNCPSNVVGKPVDAASNVKNPASQSDCPTGSNKFCCATLTETTKLCDGQIQLTIGSVTDYWKINAVTCRN